MKWAVFQFAVTEADIRKCVEWVKVGYISFKSLKLTEDDIWVVLKKFSALTSDAVELVRQNQAKTDTALYGELYCRYAYPDTKADSWQFAINSNETHSDYQQKILFQGWQAGVDSNFANRYFEALPEILETKSYSFAKNFALHMLPDLNDDAEAISQIDNVLSDIPEEYKAIRQILTVARSKFELRKNVREFND